jgi:DedD protein
MEHNLKQRLVGAIVLVSLAVIFIPIILEGPDDEWAPRSPGIPEPPRVDYHADTAFPEPDAAPQSVEPAQKPLRQSLPEATPVEPPPVAKAEKPAPVAAKPAAPPPATVDKRTGTAAPPPGWYVQVGSFSQPLNANGLRDRLQKAGYGAHAQPFSTAKGNIYRVLVGPSSARPPAEKLRGRLLKEQQLKGLIIELSS